MAEVTLSRVPPRGQNPRHLVAVSRGRQPLLARVEGATLDARVGALDREDLLLGSGARAAPHGDRGLGGDGVLLQEGAHRGGLGEVVRCGVGHLGEGGSDSDAGERLPLGLHRDEPEVAQEGAGGVAHLYPRPRPRPGPLLRHHPAIPGGEEGGLQGGDPLRDDARGAVLRRHAAPPRQGREREDLLHRGRLPAARGQRGGGRAPLRHGGGVAGGREQGVVGAQRAYAALHEEHQRQALEPCVGDRLAGDDGGRRTGRDPPESLGGRRGGDKGAPHGVAAAVGQAEDAAMGGGPGDQAAARLRSAAHDQVHDPVQRRPHHLRARRFNTP
mmetsp:Transcript_107191/g.300093  ORF Transcript_107191/g.300093 Transcript_107191/m.300093 type:complete len:329 (-) Transcript_107191:195-1181(-)